MQSIRLRRGSQLYLTSRLWRLNYRALHYVARAERALIAGWQLLLPLLAQVAGLFSANELSRKIGPNRPTLSRSEWNEQPPFPPFQQFR